MPKALRKHTPTVHRKNMPRRFGSETNFHFYSDYVEEKFDLLADIDLNEGIKNPPLGSIMGYVVIMMDPKIGSTALTVKDANVIFGKKWQVQNEILCTLDNFGYPRGLLGLGVDALCLWDYLAVALIDIFSEGKIENHKLIIEIVVIIAVLIGKSIDIDNVISAIRIASTPIYSLISEEALDCPLHYKSDSYFEERLFRLLARSQVYFLTLR